MAFGIDGCASHAPNNGLWRLAYTYSLRSSLFLHRRYKVRVIVNPVGVIAIGVNRLRAIGVHVQSRHVFVERYPIGVARLRTLNMAFGIDGCASHAPNNGLWRLAYTYSLRSSLFLHRRYKVRVIVNPVGVIVDPIGVN